MKEIKSQFSDGAWPIGKLKPNRDRNIPLLASMDGAWLLGIKYIRLFKACGQYYFNWVLHMFLRLNYPTYLILVLKWMTINGEFLFHLDLDGGILFFSLLGTIWFHIFSIGTWCNNITRPFIYRQCKWTLHY